MSPDPAATYSVTLTVTGNDDSDSITQDAGVTVFGAGDCFGGDGFDALTDAIGLANYLFSMGATPDCLAACDSNGDASLNLGDVVHMLFAAFVPGSRPPVKAAADTPCG